MKEEKKQLTIKVLVSALLLYGFILVIKNSEIESIIVYFVLSALLYKQVSKLINNFYIYLLLIILLPYLNFYTFNINNFVTFNFSINYFLYFLFGTCTFFKYIIANNKEKI